MEDGHREDIEGGRECCAVLRGAACCCVLLRGAAWCCVVLRGVVWCLIGNVVSGDMICVV